MAPPVPSSGGTDLPLALTSSFGPRRKAAKPALCCGCVSTCSVVTLPLKPLAIPLALMPAGFGCLGAAARGRGSWDDPELLRSLVRAPSAVSLLTPHTATGVHSGAAPLEADGEFP